MMNVIALAFLVSYFSAVVVLVPEPHLTQADHHVEGFTPSGLFRSTKQNAQDKVCDDKEPCPSSMDQVKDTLHQGYETTAEKIDSAKESAKETVKDAYQQAKHGVQDKTEQVKEGIQNKAEHAKHGAHETAEGIKERAGQAKQGAYETAQGIQGRVKEGTVGAAQQAKQTVGDKAGQVKHGAQEAAEKVGSYIPSTEDVKHGAYEASEVVSSYIPSKEEAASYIPGAETGKEATNVLKQKVGEAKEKVASYVKDSEPTSYGKESLDSLRSKLEEAKEAAASYMQGKEREAWYPGFFDLKKRLDEATTYIPISEKAASYIPGMESIEGIKKGVQETTQKMQDRVQDSGKSARDTAKESVQGLHDKARNVDENVRETVSSYMQEGEEAAEGYKGKIGGLFQGMKERFAGGPKTRDGTRQLERRVHELCMMWFDDGSEVPRSTEGRGQPLTLDVAAIRDSYAYLMQSALGAIDRALEVFDHATEQTAGGEWREKYVYLADSAKGALEAAKEVFERAASAAGGTVRATQASAQKVFPFGKPKDVSKLQELAWHTQHRLSATMRPLMRALYLATFSAIYGVSLWMTFLSGHLLSRTLPRQQLGIVQSKLFPVYLRMITGAVALCALVHASLHPWPSADRSERWQYWNFALCVGTSLLNMLVVEPRATKMMFEKLKVEKEEGRGQSGEEEVNDEAAKKRIAEIDTKFRGLHQMASYLNLANVAGLTWHLWYLANRLVV